MSKDPIRKFQDQMQNSGWRIKMIPHDDPDKPMKFPSNPFALGSLAIFVVGLWLTFVRRDASYAPVAIVGFMLLFFSLVLGEIWRRCGWARVKAVCLDREIRECGHREWAFRLRCRFDYSGRPYTVTPTFYRAFRSKEEVESFLDSLIDPDGMCLLSVKPNNPLQAEVVSKETAAALNHREG